MAKTKNRYRLENPTANRAELKAYFSYMDSYTGSDMLTEAWYQRIFDTPCAAGKITGEITPAYLELKGTRLRHAVNFLPKATKFIAIIREPLARALSQMRMALEESQATPEATVDWDFFINFLAENRRGDYLSAIPRWNASAGKERILYLPFSDLRERPEQLLVQIEDFIGASHFDNYDLTEERKNASMKIDIPQWVVDKVEQDLTAQRQYLINTFGAEFFARTS